MESFFCSPNDIKLLSDLLKPPQDDSSDDEEHVTKKATNTYMSPADIQKKPIVAQTQVPKKSQASKQSPYEKLEEPIPKGVLDYEDECLEKIGELTDVNTWKSTPKWDVSYRQAVTASDVFLQMGNKTAATASCENMILKIHMPRETSGSIDVKITEMEFQLISSIYFLKIPLPQPVNPQLGDAKFDNDTETLTVTLVMERELDFINY